MANDTDCEQAPLLAHSNRRRNQVRRFYHSDSESSLEPSISDTDSDGNNDSHAEFGGSTRCFGYCCAILSSLCFTSSNLIIKYIPTVSSLELLLIRCIVQIVTMIPIMAFWKHNVLGTPDLATRWRVAAQGILGGFLLMALFEAVSRISLGDCTTFFFSSPAFTMVRKKEKAPNLTLFYFQGAVQHSLEGVWCSESLGHHQPHSRSHLAIEATFAFLF